jgi:hypothetical protein
VGYQLANRLEVQVFINGTEYPLDPGTNTLNFLHMGCQVQGKLPTCHFMVTDTIKSLDQIFLQDGIPLQINLKAYGGQTQSYYFRLFHKKKSFNGAAFVYEVDGYWNAPIYWTGTSAAGIQGTSSEVLSQIARTCGLKYQGVSTSDSQLWMQRNRNYADFAKIVAQHGFITEQSYTVSGVDLTGTLLYVDANNLPAPAVQLVAYQTVSGMYTVSDYKAVTRSGLNNNLTGYNNVRFTQSQTGTTLSTPNSDVQFTPDTSAPLFNTTVKTQAARGYQTYGPIDVGNVHSSYERANYQNLRYANLYSMNAEFITLTPTPLTLFNRFTFSLETENQKLDPAYSGNYITSAKAIYVQGTNYVEKVVGSRTGTDNQYSNG